MGRRESVTSLPSCAISVETLQLATWLRREFPDALYAGVELELNQALLTSSRCRLLKPVLATSITRVLAESA